MSLAGGSTSVNVCLLRQSLYENYFKWYVILTKRPLSIGVNLKPTTKRVHNSLFSNAVTGRASALFTAVNVLGLSEGLWHG